MFFSFHFWIFSDLFDLALTFPYYCSAVFAVYKKVCIQLSYITTRFIECFVHWVNVWNRGSLVKTLGCESRNHGFESRWNKIYFLFFIFCCWHIYSLSKRWILFFPQMCCYSCNHISNRSYWNTRLSFRRVDCFASCDAVQIIMQVNIQVL